MESLTIDGDSPVYEIEKTPWIEFSSNVEHVKLGVNLSGPPDKAKYSEKTDSEPVP